MTKDNIDKRNEKGTINSIRIEKKDDAFVICFDFLFFESIEMIDY